jgi:hypothetical protein
MEFISESITKLLTYITPPKPIDYESPVILDIGRFLFFVEFI